MANDPLVEKFAVFRADVQEAVAPFMERKKALERQHQEQVQALIDERTSVIMAKAQVYRDGLIADGYPYEATRLAIAEAIKSVSKSWTDAALIEMSSQWADRIFIAGEVLEWLKLGVISADLAWLIRAEGVSPAMLAAIIPQPHKCTKDGCAHKIEGQAIGRCPDWLRNVKRAAAELPVDGNWS